VIVHPEIYFFIIYSASCCSKPWNLVSFLCWTHTNNYTNINNQTVDGSYWLP